MSGVVAEILSEKRAKKQKEEEKAQARLVELKAAEESVDKYTAEEHTYTAEKDDLKRRLAHPLTTRHALPMLGQHIRC